MQAAEARQGNYLAFFPSYRFMEEVYEEFILMLEERGRRERRRE